MTRRVLVVSHEASRTGAPRVAGHLLGALAAGGWETILVHRSGGPMRAELDALADRSLLEPGAHLRMLLRRWRPTKLAAGAVERWAARRVLRVTRPDLVWCNTVVTSPYAVAAVHAGIPVVVHSHEQRRLVGLALTRAGLRGSETVDSPLLTLVGCATDTAEALAAELSVDPGRVAVLHSPVDVAQLAAAVAVAEDPLPEGPTVVACGTGDERKGVDVFGAAAESDAGSGVSWVWVGDVPSQYRVGAVTYPGVQASALAWIAHADVVALPSRADAFPLVVLEAMALGRPVVASAVPGPVEQLGDAGVLVAPEDASALAAAVAKVIADPVHAAALGARARDRCSELWDVAPFGEQARAIADAAARHR